MMRVAVARAVSIAGHPVVLLPVAVLIAASTRGASVRHLWFIGGALATVGGVVLGFSWLQVRSGRWSNVDASGQAERHSLNVFLGVVCLLGAVLLWLLTRRPYLSLGLALSGALVVIALLIARWVKVSLHAAFAAFATALLWPNEVAVLAGVLATAAVVWSRLVLGRHIAADLAAGLLLGATAGSAYHIWVV